MSHRIIAPRQTSPDLQRFHPKNGARLGHDAAQRGLRVSIGRRQIRRQLRQHLRHQRGTLVRQGRHGEQTGNDVRIARHLQRTEQCPIEIDVPGRQQRNGQTGLIECSETGALVARGVNPPGQHSRPGFAGQQRRKVTGQGQPSGLQHTPKQIACLCTLQRKRLQPSLLIHAGLPQTPEDVGILLGHEGRWLGQGALKIPPRFTLLQIAPAMYGDTETTGIRGPMKKIKKLMAAGRRPAAPLADGQ